MEQLFIIVLMENPEKASYVRSFIKLNEKANI